MLKRFLEGDIEEIIAKHPEIIENGLTIESRQEEFKGKRVDLLFRDKLGYTLLVELKKGFVKREHVGQLIEYYGIVNEGGEERVRVMLVGSVIPLNLKRGMDGHGIEYRELNDGDYIEFLKRKDPNLLRSLQKKQLHASITLPKKTTKYIHAKPTGQKIGIMWSHNHSTPDWLEQVKKGIERHKYMWWIVGWKSNTTQFTFPIIGYIWWTAKGKVTHKTLIEQIKCNPDKEWVEENFETSSNPASYITQYLNDQRKTLTLLRLIELEELRPPQELKDFRLWNGDSISRPPNGYYRILVP